MSWEDRVSEGAYTSPEGFRFTYKFEDVSREIDLRTAVFQFPGVDGAYGQPNGTGARRYPLRCYFTGDSCDLAATEFELALCEKGHGRLEHPMYGAFDAVPMGTITRRDDLKTAANQSIVEVTFLATLPAIYPNGAPSARNELNAALLAFDLASTEEYAEQVDDSSAAARAVTKSSTRDFVRIVADSLATAASTVAAADQAFRDAQSALNYGIDLLIGQPLDLAQQVQNLVQAPARALVGVELRLQAYRALAQRIFSRTQLKTFSSLPLAALQLRLSNNFRSADLFAQQALAGSLRSTYETTYDNKPAALNSAAALLDQHGELIAWRDGGLRTLALPDPGRAQEAMWHASARAVASLIEASFSLAVERRVVLDRPRTIIDLCGELYGAVDSRLDMLIATNDLTGAEILELPRGKTIAYYT